MPRIQLTVTNPQAALFCSFHGYKAVIPDVAPGAPSGATIPNPETEMMFVERILRTQYLERDIREGKRVNRIAARKAEDEADAASITIPVGTVT